MVDKHVQNVIGILKKEYDYYKDLLELSKSKKNIIIAGKVGELEKLVKLEQNMVFDIGQLEKAREQETASLCDILGLNPNDASILQLSQKLEQKYRIAMEKLQKHLSDTLSELKKLNEVNGKLIQQSLEYIEYSINVITSANVAPGSLYEDIVGTSGTVGNKKRIFDTKV